MMCSRPGTSWILLFMTVMTGSCTVPTGLDLKLLKALTANLSDNQAISPFVMSTLMTQVWLGARGTTRSEMTPVLGLGPSAPNDFLPAYQYAIDYLSTGSSNVITAFFNRMYIRNTFSIKPTFTSQLTTYYRAGAKTFSSPSQAASQINTDVANVTRNRIKDLVSVDTMRGAELALVSALYFKGVWKFTFNPAVKAPFQTDSGEKQVDMMILNETILQFARVNMLDAVALPYTDEDYGMLLIKPVQDNMTAVRALRDSFNTLNITDLIGQLKPSEVRVSMPRFMIKTEYNLNDAMKQLGIQKIFDSGADFGGIASGSLFVSDIIHKVSIEVTEHGTEAAGAGVIPFLRITPVYFTANRPFFAVVYNRKHKINMFSAYIGSP